MEDARRRELIRGASLLLLLPLGAIGQEAGKVRRIGFLGLVTPTEYANRLNAFKAGLRDLGYIEGRNLVIEYRWAEGRYDRLPDLAAELVALNVEVIVTYATLGVRAARQATSSIPIVMSTAGDAILAGLVTNLARPGVNITGSTFFQPETSAKRLELLRQALPHARRVALFGNPDNPALEAIYKSMERTAKALKLETQRFGVSQPSELENAFTAISKRRINAIVLLEDPVLTVNSKAIAGAALKLKVPSIGFAAYADAGGLMSYGVDLVDLNRQAATFVDKILKGAKVGDIPIERASKFELVVNLKTAHVLGVKIPQVILVRAYRVIE